MTYATPTDVAKEMRGSTSVSATEAVQWPIWLESVERTIRRRFKRAGYELDEQVGEGDPLAADVVDVEVAAVIRKIGLVETNQSIRPGMSRTRSVDDASITDRNDGRIDPDYDPLALTDAEWASLLPTPVGGAFSTRPGFQPDVPAFDPWAWT